MSEYFKFTDAEKKYLESVNSDYDSNYQSMLLKTLMLLV